MTASLSLALQCWLRETVGDLYLATAEWKRFKSTPALERVMPDGTTRLVKFDGVDGNIMIGRKLLIVTTSKAQGQALRQPDVLSQNGLTGRCEVPTAAQQNRAIKMLNNLNISNISVKVVKPW